MVAVPIYEFMLGTGCISCRHNTVCSTAPGGDCASGYPGIRKKSTIMESTLSPRPIREEIYTHRKYCTLRLKLYRSNDGFFVARVFCPPPYALEGCGDELY